MTKICLGFKAHMGWVNAVGVEVGTKEPVPLWAAKVELVPKDDREAYEPYHLAGGWQELTQGPRPRNPQAIIKRGTKKQLAAATAVLRELRGQLKADNLILSHCVMLTTRSITHTLEEALAYHSHIHIAEGQAIRDATRGALKAMRVKCLGQDEKSILPAITEQLAWADPDDNMKSRRPPDTRAWSKEERLVALGAWLHA